ncbi:MAG: hypothetical protein CMD92_08185 [Gammaproteobacteria bacterium]|nr:hypothetical protein [Gammaproteobacteria bacterium]|tara:strand:- start:16650 stop:17273 length:624 start_codon:yes stop_codon:yes gene_type:complete
MALVWNGRDWSRTGSETECSSSDASQYEGWADRAILESLGCPPPIPMLHSHAKVTAKAVIAYVLSVPAMRRTRAHDLALSLSRNAPSIHIWVQKQLRAGRKSHTIKTALTLALNPTRTATWACRETGARVGHQQPILGLAYNVRMHPFTRAEVEDACDMLEGYQPYRAPERYQCGTDVATLEAAVAMIVFNTSPRCFGAPRYRYIVK